MSLPMPPDGRWTPRPGYRRTTYAPASDPGPLAAGTRALDWVPQADRRRGVAGIILAVLGALGLAAILVVVVAQARASSGYSDTTTVVLIATALALLPLTLVTGAVIWIDRWERESYWMLLLAFLWGAGVSTIVALALNTPASMLIYQSTGDPQSAEYLGRSFVAPLVEESAKALGVLLLFLIWRRAFNGPVDGIVYATVVAGGFAFAENIVYFVGSSSSVEKLLGTFIMRGVFSPFAHVTFTACTGLAIGASARMRSRTAWIWTTPLGLVCAIVLHAFWNGVLNENFLLLYAAIEMPLFMGWVGLVIWLRWSERMRMRARLSDYQRAGWYGPAEIMMITTGSGRSAARRWARSRGPLAVSAMKSFLRASAALAQLRQQAIDGHAEADFSQQEAALLRTVSSSRRIFTGSGPA